ncbi:MULTISPECIES: permease-like cell division protein FtsX [Geomicrobium]|uniref:Cell division protein FtsX n=2 Tax=Geomicrobium TaxID=767528 RepID=A0ABS2P797_9BACL|nr:MULTISPECIES: permease-like cell division protein FtsX [Geomicrobium]MBM7631260.1 cell division transport system permease protein [Geomicrobium sediminis]GAK07239.1 cell division protein FtsX [Geomicrobium sp. JCM 19038]
MAIKRKTLTRHGREGFKNIRRNGWMSFASMSAVAIMLFVVGAFAFLIVNTNHLIDTIENDVEIRAFFEHDVDASEQESVLEEVESHDSVENVVYRDRDEGLDVFMESMGSDGEVFENLREENPLNDALIIQATDPQMTAAVAEEVNAQSAIESVEYGESILGQLFTVTNYVRILGGALVIGLIFTSVFLISNTIKLTILSRKDEIQIMKLVGATNSFVRFPFFIEGALIGLIGAIIPIAGLTVGYSYLYSFMYDQVPFFTFVEPNPMIWQISGLLLLVSILVGIFGSQMSVRKFLKV